MNRGYLSKFLPKISSKLRLCITILILGIGIGISASVYFHHHYTIVRKPQFSSQDYRGMAWEMARRYHLDATLVFAIVQQESSWNPKAISPKGAIGLMQIMPATAKSFCGLTEVELFDPQKNLDCGIRYFARQIKTFGSVKLALCAYNAGPTKVRELGRCPRFQETTRYARQILTNWQGDVQ